MNDLKSNYKIFANYNLVIECHSGILTAKNYIEFKKKVLADASFKANLNHFIDFKNVKFNTSPSDISEFVDFIKSNIQSFGNRKVALITNTPNQVVSTTIYKLMQADSSQIVEIFSINENALKWHNLPTTALKEVLNTIQQLETT